MFLYLLLKRPNLADMKAAAELFKESYGAVCRGYGYGMGLVYATRTPVSEIDQDILGIVVWN